MLPSFVRRAAFNRPSKSATAATSLAAGLGVSYLMSATAVHVPQQGGGGQQSGGGHQHQSYYHQQMHEHQAYHENHHTTVPAPAGPFTATIDPEEGAHRAHRLMTPRQLPFYGDPDSLNEWIYLVPERTGLEMTISKVRRGLGPYYESLTNGVTSLINFFSTTAANLQEPRNDPLKYGLIALGGVSGASLGISRSLRSKVALPIAGALGMAAFLFPDSMPKAQDAVAQECRVKGEWTFWFFRSLYCDIMDTMNRLSGQRINLFDDSMTDLYEETFGKSSMEAFEDPGNEAPMSMLVTMLPPPPAITSTAGKCRSISMVPPIPSFATSDGR